MIQYKAFIASSLDGFIARTDGSIDWLSSKEFTLENNDLGYSSFMEGIECIVMGRITFETVLTFETYPFGSIPIYVLTRNLDYKFKSEHPIRIFQGTLEELDSDITKKQFKTVYVDGGKLIQSYLAKHMLNELTITTIPILLGSGLPLFGNSLIERKLNHIQTSTFSNGFIQTKYQIS
ncbi:dihydrofolate reductase family protein [Leptospira perdikensis]|uniref:Dihydrofolate reductase n=1 Tax=Leptospira perdikensis TaxID=2484948 RepID=A0A4R9J6T1_9LEPT|nr:dihydrofolate reductase family protein [Leptospira perdikensis]TGL33398.1 dihydrofolate reductase [Leptospira perdikensis]